MFVGRTVVIDFVIPAQAGIQALDRRSWFRTALPPESTGHDSVDSCLRRNDNVALTGSAVRSRDIYPQT